jgi:hypothetical protein
MTEPVLNELAALDIDPSDSAEEAGIAMDHLASGAASSSKSQDQLVIWPAAYSRGASLRLVRNPLPVAEKDRD